MTIRRFSSRTERLSDSFLMGYLSNAVSYHRIAGYFTSSLFEIANEPLQAIPNVKIVCNSAIHPSDFKIAQSRNRCMLARFNENQFEIDALLHEQRYQQLNQFLEQPNHSIRVASDDICGFVHGKAGVITLKNGKKIGFIGSVNETQQGWENNYEILWEDDSPEGIQWIQDEFNYLWERASPLPSSIIQEVKRRYHRREVDYHDIKTPEDMAPAVLVESPLYREGYSLEQWQESFVTECLRHYRLYGLVRLLLADEVGLGKTLSLGVAALTLCLLSDRDDEKNKSKKSKPIVIFAPASLCEQWQTEMIDKLGIRCARWETNTKTWLDPNGQTMSNKGHTEIKKCPLRIGIISTGLITQNAKETECLRDLKYGIVILDEAHKARSERAINQEKIRPNNLLGFMKDIATSSDHVLLGTATPIQTQFQDLWDLLDILDSGNGNFVLGDPHSKWHQPDIVIPILSGKERISDAEKAWDFIRSPLPFVDSTDEKSARLLFNQIRSHEKIGENKFETALPFSDLDKDTKMTLQETLNILIQETTFLQRENPLLRHIVLRKRATLEEKKLLPKIDVNLHHQVLKTDQHFKNAYATARQFGQLLSQHQSTAGFMKNLMAQRLTSSVVACRNTAHNILNNHLITNNDDEEDVPPPLDDDFKKERQALQDLVDQLDAVKLDKKTSTIIQYLYEKKWLEHGVIIFSQYYDTAEDIAKKLAEQNPSEAIGLYAGAERSKWYQHKKIVNCPREKLKNSVAEHRIRLMVATDAASEGLNLQTLGTLINVDLPWNPTRLEQRIGRIKRIGQTRKAVDMLTLVYEETVDEAVYKCISERMKNIYELFGSLPDIIQDGWVENIEIMNKKLDEQINAQKKATGFEIRYRETLRRAEKDWRTYSDVLSRQDLFNLMNTPWKT